MDRIDRMGAAIRFHPIILFILSIPVNSPIRLSAYLMPPRVVLFDLDNTLYPPECGLLAHLDDRINDFVAGRLRLSIEEARALRRRYVHEYGTTLHGLKAEEGVPPEEYLAAVHDAVELERFLTRDEELLAALAAIEIDKVVFTNAPRDYARRVMECLGLDAHFRVIIDLEFHDYNGKPFREAYERVTTHLEVHPEECVLVEDTLRNLRVAKEVGMTTILVGPLEEQLDYVDHVVERPAQVTDLIARLMMGD
jgi:putative hydrolase of the HAD superfamily